MAIYYALCRLICRQNCPLLRRFLFFYFCFFHGRCRLTIIVAILAFSCHTILASYRARLHLYLSPILRAASIKCTSPLSSRVPVVLLLALSIIVLMPATGARVDYAGDDVVDRGNGNSPGGSPRMSRGDDRFSGNGGGGSHSYHSEADATGAFIYEISFSLLLHDV